jgi:hypothetical protein
MKKCTSIIGEVGRTNAHLIKESDRYFAIRSQQILAMLFNIKARANVNVSVSTPSIIETVTVILFGNFFVRKLYELIFGSRNSDYYPVFQDDPGERRTILHDHQILTVKECIHQMDIMKSLLYGGRVQNTLSKIPV